MGRGELVPDEVVIEIVREGIASPKCKKGFMLDGFPRNVAQAKALDKILEKEGKKLHKVVCLELSNKEVSSRVAGRMLHADSGRSYHKTFRPPVVAGKDDVTGDDLVYRSDDNPNSVHRRLQSYYSETRPFVEYYKKQNVLETVDAEPRNIPLIYRRLVAAISGKAGPFPVGPMEAKVQSLRAETNLMV